MTERLNWTELNWTELKVYVMVCVWVGKEFPDGRKNEKELKFIRVGDSQNSGWAQGKTDIEQGSLVHFYTQGYKERDRGLAGLLPIG